MAVWDDLSGAVEDLGIEISYNHAQLPQPKESQVNFPSALQTTDGKNHLAATESLLGVSHQSAAQITLSALQSLAAEPDDYPKLLGTLMLLEKVADFHYHQRLSRLGILVECLRAEQDESVPGRMFMLNTLDNIDKLTTDKDSIAVRRGAEKWSFPVNMRDRVEGKLPASSSPKT